MTTKKDTKSDLVVIDYGQDAGAGFEGIDKESLAIPFLKVLQALSPECNESSDDFIAGAKVGHFFNTVTKESIGVAVNVIPCYYKRIFNQWGDKKKGSE